MSQADKPCHHRNLWSISWFVDLRTLLSSYIDVLRYELDQHGNTETIEALIHAEILKILRRKLPSSVIRSEYPIGHFFAKLKVFKEPDKAPRETKRKFRADVAVFRPWELLNEQDSSNGTAEDLRTPIAIIEIKRDGLAKELMDDLYRLTICSLRTGAVGYFVLAAPAQKLIVMKRSVEVLKDLANSEIQDFGFSALGEASIFDQNDLLEAKGSTFSIKQYPALMEEGQEPGNDDLAMRSSFSFYIFGVSVDRKNLETGADQRFNIRLTEAEAPNLKKVPGEQHGSSPATDGSPSTEGTDGLSA